MKYLTISYTVVPLNKSIKPREYQHVLLSTPDGEMFYHPEGGPSHFYIKDYEVEKEHGDLNVNDEEDWEVIQSLVIENSSTYHRPCHKAVQSGGWLSPEGKYYTCRYWEHDYLAETICRSLLGTLEGAKKLENSGWLRVHEDGQIGGIRLRGPVTQAQIDTLWDICEASDEGSEFRESIEWFIKLYSRKEQ